MNSEAQSPTAVPEASQLPGAAASVVRIRREGSKLVSVSADGRELALTRLVGSHLRVGDEVLIHAPAEQTIADAEIYIRKTSLRRADIYHAKVAYAALPKPDKRSELFVKVEVVGGQSGIDAIHIPCSAIRDYFFAANRKASWQSQPSFYYLLHLPADVPFKELRLGYRIRRMELMKENASQTELATI